MNFRGASGTTDKFTINAQTLGAQVTYLAWIRPISEGLNNLGCILQLGGSGAQRMNWRFNGTAGQRRLRMISNRSTPGQWEMTTGFAALPKLIFAAMTYDGASAANDPVLYTLVDNVFSILTVGSGLTRVATPSGAEPGDGVTLYIGSSSASDQTFDGTLDELAAYRRLLAADEVRSVAYKGVRSVLRLLHGYWKLDRIQGGTTAYDFSGNGRHLTLAGAPTAVSSGMPRYPVGVGAA